MTFVQNEGSLHQSVCRSDGTMWLVEASKKLDEKIKRGREIRHKCPYILKCGNLPSQCAEVYPECQEKIRETIQKSASVETV